MSDPIPVIPVSEYMATPIAPRDTGAGGMALNSKHKPEESRKLLDELIEDGEEQQSRKASILDTSIIEQKITLVKEAFDTSIIDEKIAQVKEEFTANSHDLAQARPDIQGAVQVHQNGDATAGVRNVGWHQSTDKIPVLLGQVSNDELFTMIRRFNKDVFAVRSIPAFDGLDLNDAWSDEYQTDKLTLNMQRVYLSVVLGFSSFLKQVARLRSWKETRRTGAFCAAYTLAWLLNLLIPLTLGMLLLIISSPVARETLFPSAPRSLVSLKTGGLQTPQAGQLGTTSTLTGAPEKEPGEAIEEEASSFVDNIRHVVQRIVGMHDNPDGDGDPLEGKIPKPIRKAVKSVKAKGAAAGHTQDTQDEEQTKAPMEEMIWEKTKPEILAPMVNAVPHVLGEIVDTWERMANALEPTAPFSRFSYLRLSVVILPLFLASLFTTYYVFYKVTGLAIGFLIFGDPAITPAFEWLNFNYPNWSTLAQPKNNILLGVPTNIQLTLTLLRIGELNNAPIPPVPSSADSGNLKPDVSPSDIPLAGTETEKIIATQPSPSFDQDSTTSGKKGRTLSKIASIFKGNTKAGIHTKLAVDKARATMGSEKAKGHVGVMAKHEDLIFTGPENFRARYQGKEGCLILTSSPFPALKFRYENGVEMDIAIKDIKELKRATTFSGKAAEVVGGWASNAGRELLGSLEVVGNGVVGGGEDGRVVSEEDGDNGEQTWRFTACAERDEVFNRVVAARGCYWENL